MEIIIVFVVIYFLVKRSISPEGSRRRAIKKEIQAQEEMLMRLKTRSSWRGNHTVGDAINNCADSYQISRIEENLRELKRQL